MAERLPSAVAEQDFGTAHPVTASLGVAGLEPEQDVADLQAAADRALYRAKRAGRDRVVPAESL
jgi:diguanylate cyclase (GGDEF)-like protein